MNQNFKKTALAAAIALPSFSVGFITPAISQERAAVLE